MNPESAADWTVRPFLPAEESSAAWRSFHAYRRARHEEARHDEPLAPDEAVEANMKIESPTWRRSRFVVEADGGIVGTLYLNSPKPGSPEYASTKHIVYMGMGVLGEFRRKGIGTQLLARSLDELDRREARVLSGYSGEDDGHAFARWCGAEPTQVERLSRLEWATIDWGQVDRWIAALETRAPGASLQLFPDHLPDDFIEEYCPVRTELMNLMPWGDAEHGDIVVTPDDIERMYERLAITSTDHHTYICREPDSTISGITDVSWTPEIPTEVDQWFTGVHPDYRGRGVGKALKAAMLRYLDERYDGLVWMRTGNATENASMLSINERLGFREYRRVTSYQIDRDRLATLLKTV